MKIYYYDNGEKIDFITVLWILKSTDMDIYGRIRLIIHVNLNYVFFHHYLSIYVHRK